MRAQAQSTVSAHADVPSVVAAAFPALPTRCNYFTVAQFAERNPAFSQAAVRNLVHKAEDRKSTRGTVHGNGLIKAGAILRIGRKVLIDEDRFFEWVRRQNAARD